MHTLKPNLTIFLSIFIVIVLGIQACTNPTETGQHEKTKHPMSQQLDDYFTALTKLKRFNGCVYIQKDGQDLLRKAYNLSEEKDSSLFVEIESQFDLRSIAKLFAKLSIVEMEQKGQLNHQDKLVKYLPNFPNAAKITIEDLMLNQSGLPRELSNFDGNEIDLTAEETIELIAKETLEFEPGTDQRYSNLGFQLLFYLIAKQSGKPFAAYLNENFFERIPMPASGAHFGIDKSNLKQYAYGHFLKDKGIVAIKDFQNDEFRVGNLYADVDDLMKLLNFLAEEPYRTALSKDETVGHAGGTKGKRAYIFRDHAQDYNIVFLANYDEIPFEEITNDIKKILEGKAYTMPKEYNRQAVKVSTAILQKYVGRYDFAEIEHLKLDVKLDSGKLFLYQNGENGGELIPENDSVFFFDPKSGESFAFKKTKEEGYKAILDFKGAKWEGKREN